MGGNTDLGNGDGGEGGGGGVSCFNRLYLFGSDWVGKILHFQMIKLLIVLCDAIFIW